MATETFPFVSEMRAKGRAEGRAEGEAKAVLRILKRRKVAVDDASQQRIESCTNVKTLETWLDRSLTAITVRTGWGRCRIRSWCAPSSDR